MPELVVYVTLRGDNVATYEWECRLPLEKDVDAKYRAPKGFSEKSSGSHLPTFRLATSLQAAKKKVARFQFDSQELMVERKKNTPWGDVHKCVEELLGKVEGKKIRLVHHDEPDRLGLHGISGPRKR